MSPPKTAVSPFEAQILESLALLHAKFDSSPKCECAILKQEVAELKELIAKSNLAPLPSGKSACEVEKALNDGSSSVDNSCRAVSIALPTQKASTTSSSHSILEIPTQHIDDWKAQLASSLAAEADVVFTDDQAVYRHGLVHGNVLYLDADREANIHVAYGELGSSIVGEVYWKTTKGWTAFIQLRSAIDVDDAIITYRQDKRFRARRPGLKLAATRPIKSSVLRIEHVNPSILRSDRLCHLLLADFRPKDFKFIDGGLRIFCKDAIAAGSVAAVLDGWSLLGTILRVVQE